MRYVCPEKHLPELVGYCLRPIAPTMARPTSSLALLLAASLCIAAVRAVSFAAPHALHALRPTQCGCYIPSSEDPHEAPPLTYGDVSLLGGNVSSSSSAALPRTDLNSVHAPRYMHALRGGGGVSSSASPPSEALHLSESDHDAGREGGADGEATDLPEDNTKAALPSRGLLRGLVRRTTHAALWLSRACVPLPFSEEDEEGECVWPGWRGCSDPSMPPVQAANYPTTQTPE
jgi:hypothetical protein